MSDDVDMSNMRQQSQNFSPKSPLPASPPPASVSSRSSSASLHDHNIENPSTSDGNKSVAVVEHVNDPDVKKPNSTASLSAKPASTKPKSTKPARPRSPSPSPPPPPPPPLQTIRLEIKLGGPDNYEVDISSMAKATGQRAPTPVRVKRDSSDSEGDDEGDKDKVKDKPKSKKKKKNLGSEYYDLNDPFIDDSELAVDERTFFAQTKQQGFYVSSGEVALLKDKTTPKKPKSKKLGLLPLTDTANASAGPSTHISALKKEGTKDSPIPLLSDGEDDKLGQKRKRPSSVMEGGKKRKVEIHDFSPELQIAIDDLKTHIAQESWEAKGRFPQALKPVLAEVALKAVRLGEYDDRFFSFMPSIFPYNKFTMSKLIKRTIFQGHTHILMERQDALIQDLAALTKDGFSKAQEEWEKSVVQWEKRQEKEKAKAEAEVEPGSAEPSTRQDTEDAGSGMEQDHPPAPASAHEKDGAGAGKEPHPPPRKYRLTDEMKVLVWRIVAISNECCKLENEKNSLEGSNLQVSEQGLRKILYQKIVAAFPEGWMSSGQISREVSSMKKRLEKEAMELENES